MLQGLEIKPTTKATGHAFHFICGNDDYLVTREGQELFEKLSKNTEDPLSKEIIEASAPKTAHVNGIVNNFQQAIQTLSLFGEKKVVWLKGIDFISDSVTGRSEGTKEEVDRLAELLRSIDPSATDIILTASPVDRRTKQFKSLQKTSNFTYIDADSANQNLPQLAQAEAKKLGVKINSGALTILLEKIGNNSRLLIQEIDKLATYLGKEGTVIEESLIQELVPQFGGGDFFEFTEAFFSLDLTWSLNALKQHFFTQKESRPILSALQNRNRLLLQIKALLDANAIKMSFRGLDKGSFEQAAAQYNLPFADPKNKHSFNVFSQNPWYLSRLTQSIQKLSLKKLIEFQKAFLQAFEDILSNPVEQEAILRTMTLKCLQG